MHTSWDMDPFMAILAQPVSLWQEAAVPRPQIRWHIQSTAHPPRSRHAVGKPTTWTTPALWCLSSTPTQRMAHHRAVQPRHGWQPREGVPALVFITCSLALFGGDSIQCILSAKFAPLTSVIVSTRLRLFEPTLCIHISRWQRHTFVNVVRRRLLVRIQSIISVEIGTFDVRWYCLPDFDFLSPLLSAPIHPNNDTSHPLTSFRGDYWCVFNVFYLFKLAPFTSVDGVYQISTFWAPCSVHPYILTTTTRIH